MNLPGSDDKGRCSECGRQYNIIFKDCALKPNICLNCHYGIKPPDRYEKRMKYILNGGVIVSDSF